MSWWESGHVEKDAEPLLSTVIRDFDPRDVLHTLTAKQRFVVELRYGLKDGEVYTLEEIAEVMGIAIPNVWKHEHAALKKLGATG